MAFNTSEAYTIKTRLVNYYGAKVMDETGNGFGSVPLVD